MKAGLLTRMVLVLMGAVGAHAGAGPSDVFKVDGKTPERGWVTFDETPPDPETSASPMLARLNGVAAVLDPDALRQLRRSARGAPTEEGAIERWWVAHLERDGEIATIEPGRVMDLEGPYLEGGVQLERDVMADRFGATTGENAPLSGITRVLDEERMWVRLPAGYDPARPAGVVVWVSPSETWRIPGQFFGTLDEHNLIACGVDNAGNFRKTRDGSTHGIVDRLQLMFDVLQTVRSRFEVDDERIYITGFSGGGRVSSILTCTFPEIFRGATPIVGLDSYAPATVAEGKYVPGRFPKPRGARWKLLTSRRIWALTGSKDFNLVEMKARVEQMAKDGLAIRLHSTPGMEHHEMPAEAVVREALEWVDEPAREAMEAGWARADELWDAYVEAHGERLPPGEAPRAQLIEITRVGPFGESAWKAAELLGYTRPVRPGVSP